MEKEKARGAAQEMADGILAAVELFYAYPTQIRFLDALIVRLREGQVKKRAELEKQRAKKRGFIKR